MLRNMQNLHRLVEVAEVAELVGKSINPEAAKNLSNKGLVEIFKELREDVKKDIKTML